MFTFGDTDITAETHLRATRGQLKVHFTQQRGLRVCVCVFWICADPGGLEAVAATAKFLLLPGMSLRVYVRARAGSVYHADSHTHIHCKYHRSGLCMYSLSPSLSSRCILLSEEASKR